MTASPLRIGIIGAGWFASRRHCPDVQENPEAELTALCRRDEKKLQKMADHFGVTSCFTDYHEMLTSGLIDGVIVCSPHSLHYEHGKAALESGLHVMIEKPVTLDAQQGRELFGLAREKDLALVVAQNPPYWSHCRLLREEFQAGSLGEVEAAELHWLGNAEAVFGAVPMPDSLPGVVPPTLFRKDPQLNGGGWFVDGGSHLICELIWCTGLKVAEVAAQMDDAEWDLQGSLSLKLENGALGTITWNARSGIFDKRVHSLYFGSKGSAIFRGVPFNVTLEKHKQEAVTRSEDELPPASSPLQNWLDSILGRSQPELSEGDATHIVEVLTAAYQSAREGRTVRI